MSKFTENFDRGRADPSAPSNPKNHHMPGLWTPGKTATALGDLDVPGMNSPVNRMTTPPKPERPAKGGMGQTQAGPDAKSARGGVSKGGRARRRR